MKKKVEVKQEHINKGVRADRCNCPVALALKEAFQTENVLVTPGIFVNDIYLSASINIPVIDFGRNLCQIITHFDIFGDLAPFSFELEYDETVVC